jgi:hypothetical protein
MDAVLQLKKRLGSEEKPEKGCIESRDEGDRLPRVIKLIFVSTVCSSHFFQYPKAGVIAAATLGLEELPLITLPSLCGNPHHCDAVFPAEVSQAPGVLPKDMIRARKIHSLRPLVSSWRRSRNSQCVTQAHRSREVLGVYIRYPLSGLGFMTVPRMRRVTSD